MHGKQCRKTAATTRHRQFLLHSFWFARREPDQKYLLVADATSKKTKNFPSFATDRPERIRVIGAGRSNRGLIFRSSAGIEFFRD